MKVLYSIVAAFSVVVVCNSQIDVGQELAIGNTWNSVGGTFSFGFYPDPTAAGMFNLAVWYSSIQTLIWKAMASDDTPLRVSKSAGLAFTNEGLVLTDGSKQQHVWRSTILQCDQCVQSGSMTEGGNFALLSKDGDILWQSFSYPVDTLVSEQQLLGDMVLKSGKYSLRMNAVQVYLLFEDYVTQPYWDMTNKDLQLSDPNLQVLPRLNLSSDGVLTFYDGQGNSWNNATTGGTSHRYMLDYGTIAQRRITLENNGNLRAYSLSERNDSWTVVWQAKLLECDVFGACGPFGICSYTPTLSCTCPPGFHRVDASDRLRGCAQDTPLKGDECAADKNKLVQLERADYPWNDYNFNASATKSIDDCKRDCLEDCKCLAAAYKYDGSGLCFHKGDGGVLYNGVQSLFQNNFIFLKVSSQSSVPGLAGGNDNAFVGDVNAPKWSAVRREARYSRALFVALLVVAVVLFLLLAIGLLLFVSLR